MADEKNKPRLAELLSNTSNDVISSNDTVLDLMNRNLIILTQISDNFYNIAGKLGARISSMKEVEDAILEEDKQAAPVMMLRQEPQAVAVSRNNETKPKKQSSGLGLTALGIALMMGKDIIDGMINFFKNPFEIISNLLGSLGEGIVEWFEEGGFKNFIVEAFDEGKKDLIKVFENLKDIFKILFADPVANLIDDVKLSFISVSMSGLKMLPDWLKGDSIKQIEMNLEKSKGNIEAGKETRAKENQATRSELKKRNAAPAVSSAEPPKQTVQDVKSEAPQQPPAPQQSPKQTVEDLKKEAPKQQEPVPQQSPKQTVEDLKKEAPKQQEPVPTPPQSAAAPTTTPSVTTATRASVVTDPGAAFKNVSVEQQALPVLADRKPTAVGAIKMPDETVGAAIKEAAKKVGTDESIMLAMAKQESGFNPSAKAGTSSAKGLFQFLDSTWKGMADKYSKSFPELLRGPMDVLASAISGALYIKENSVYLKKNNIPVTGTTIYASHFLGPGGARKLLQADPNAIAASLPGMGGPAKANKYIFYKPGLDKKPDLSAPRTAGEIMEILYNKVGKSAEQYAAVASNPSVGGNISVASASVNSAKKRSSQQVVYNINNNVATAVKVGAPRGSSTTIARPVGTG